MNDYNGIFYGRNFSNDSSTDHVRGCRLRMWECVKKMKYDLYPSRPNSIGRRLTQQFHGPPLFPSKLSPKIIFDKLTLIDSDARPEETSDERATGADSDDDGSA